MKTPLSSSDSPARGVHTTLEDLLKLKAKAHGFSFLPRQPVTSLLAGRHASRLRGRGLAFEEMRLYAQGDDVRTIDWKATARLRKPHVRVYSEERERPVMVVVDQRSPMFFGSRRAMKSVAAAEAAALAAWRALAVGDRVGGIVFSDNECIELPPHRSQTRVLRLLHEIVRLNQLLAGNPDSRPPSVTLNHVMESALRHAKHDHLVVILSDFDGADEETRRLATKLAVHNDVIAAAVYDPLGASLKGQPGMLASHHGRIHEIPTGEAFAGKFQKAFSDRLDEWTRIFRGIRVPVIPISAAEPVPDQLRAHFGAHMDRKAQQ